MKKTFPILQVLGFLLILGSLGLLLFSRFQSQQGQLHAQEMVRQIRAVLPDSGAGLPGSYSDPRMPVLQVEGQDVACLLEVPAYGLTLPVAASWDSKLTASIPCRFYGSVYDGTMIIGGSDQPGQFDFFTRLDPGDRFRVTDMLGAEFSYTVQRIDRSKTADYEKLSQGDFPLTLFVRSTYSMEYILVRCVLEP